MEITACPNCGSKNISSYLTIIGMQHICKDCGSQNPPFIFNSEEDYHIFLEELKKQK